MKYFGYAIAFILLILVIVIFLVKEPNMRYRVNTLTFKVPVGFSGFIEIFEDPIEGIDVEEIAEKSKSSEVFITLPDDGKISLTSLNVFRFGCNERFTETNALPIPMYQNGSSGPGRFSFSLGTRISSKTHFKEKIVFFIGTIHEYELKGGNNYWP